MDISVIILNYKCKGDTLNCLKSLKESELGGLSLELIVVDNDSDDSLGDLIRWQFPDVVFIQNEKNLGMGAGNNKGLRSARGRYLVVANPDIVVFEDTLRVLYEYMEDHPDAGIVGPRQLNPDGSLQESCFRWPSALTPAWRRTPLGYLWFARRDLDRYLMRDWSHTTIREVDWLLGSFLFCRREALERAGWFDPRYFLYFEDTDLCHSVWQSGYRVIYHADTQIIHNHRRQSAAIAWYKFFFNKATRHHVRSWLKYLLKWGIKRPESKTDQA